MLKHYSGRPRGDTFIPIAIETYGALLSQRDEFLRDCARRAFSDHGGSSLSTSVLVTWFRQRVAVALQRAQARAIHARTDRLEASSSSLSTFPSRAIISAGDLMAIAGSSLDFLCAGCLFGREFHGTVLNAREFPSYTYLVCWH